MIQHEETSEVYSSATKFRTRNIPTPEEPRDPEAYTPIQQRIYDKFLDLKELEKLNPHDNEASRTKFFSRFDWSDTTLRPDERQNIEEILIELHDFFARQRFDIVINCEFKVKLTPNDDRPSYSQAKACQLQLTSNTISQ